MTGASSVAPGLAPRGLRGAAAVALAGVALLPAGAAAAGWHTGLPIAPDRIGLGPPVAALGRGGEAVGAWTVPERAGRAVRIEVRARHGHLAPWLRELRSGAVPTGGGPPAAAMSPGGSAAVAWRASGGGVRVATRVGRRGPWRVAAVPSGPPVAGPDGFRRPALAVRDGGAVEVVWVAREGTGWVVRGASRPRAGAGWSAAPALVPDGGGAPVASLAPAAAAAVWTAGGAVRAAARVPGGAWTPPATVAPAGSGPSVAVAGDGAVRVAWTASEGGAAAVRAAAGDVRTGAFGAPREVAAGSLGDVAAGAGGGVTVAFAPPGGTLAGLVSRPGAATAATPLAAPGDAVEASRAAVAMGARRRGVVTWVDREGPGSATAGMATAIPGGPWRAAAQPVGEDVDAPAPAVGPDGDVLVLTAAVGRSGTGRTVLAAGFDGVARPRLAGTVAGRRLDGVRVAWTVAVRNPSRVRAAGVVLRVRFCCGARPVAPLPRGAVVDRRVVTIRVGALPPGGRRTVRLVARHPAAGRAAPPAAEARAVAVPPVGLRGPGA